MNGHCGAIFRAVPRLTVWKRWYSTTEVETQPGLHQVNGQAGPMRALPLTGSSGSLQPLRVSIFPQEAREGDRLGGKRQWIQARIVKNSPQLLTLTAPPDRFALTFLMIRRSGGCGGDAAPRLAVGGDVEEDCRFEA
jgi:hypothetical protein